MIWSWSCLVKSWQEHNRNHNQMQNISQDADVSKHTDATSAVAFVNCCLSSWWIRRNAVFALNIPVLRTLEVACSQQNVAYNANATSPIRFNQHFDPGFSAQSRRGSSRDWCTPLKQASHSPARVANSVPSSCLQCALAPKPIKAPAQNPSTAPPLGAVITPHITVSLSPDR